MHLHQFSTKPFKYLQLVTTYKSIQCLYYMGYR